MKFMLIMGLVDHAAIEAQQERPLEEIIAEMGAYNEAMLNAGVMTDGAGLSDATEGVVVEFTGNEPAVFEGAYGNLRELFNGFWMLEVASKEEAVEWAKRAPLAAGAQIEVRRVAGPEDFPQDNEWVQKEQQWIAEGRTGASGA